MNKLEKIKNYLKIKYGTVNEKEYTYEEYDNISHYYRYKAEKENDREYVDDITWHDLDMDNVFLQINNTHSSVGQEYLYYMLRTQDATLEELKKRDAIVEAFSENEQLRVDLGAPIYRLGYAPKISLSDYILNLGCSPKVGLIKHTLCAVALVVAILSMFFVDASYGLMALIITSAISLGIYFADKPKVESYFTCFKYVEKMSKCADKLTVIDNTVIREDIERLKGINAKIKPSLRGISFLSDSKNVDGSIAQALLDYLRIFFHIDLIVYSIIKDKLADKMDDIFGMYEIIGYLEGMTAVSSFRKLLAYYSKPEITADTSLSIEDGFHPLIVNPVSNSIRAEKSVLITGSNASGKSTFIRMIGINALLAQTIYTTCARKYSAPIFRIYSSIALSDNLEGGDSYYMVEIKSLKRIVEASKKQGTPVLCFVDEVLRGTNTVERIAASSTILENIAKENTVCFAATHDIELTKILVKFYDNYHFREDVQDDDIHFNYQIHEGPSKTRNAIKLLGIIGYDKEILEKSDKRAQEFIEKGEWSEIG